jgi:hypothetical protein
MGFAAKKPESATQLIERLRATQLTPADVKALIGLTHEAIAEDLERCIREAKASASGRDLPEPVIRQDLTKRGCACFAALNWLANE